MKAKKRKGGAESMFPELFRVRMPKAMVEELKTIGRGSLRTPSQVAREAITEYLNRAEVASR